MHVCVTLCVNAAAWKKRKTKTMKTAFFPRYCSRACCRMLFSFRFSPVHFYGFLLLPFAIFQLKFCIRALIFCYCDCAPHTHNLSTQYPFHYNHHVFFVPLSCAATVRVYFSLWKSRFFILSMFHSNIYFKAIFCFIFNFDCFLFLASFAFFLFFSLACRSLFFLLLNNFMLLECSQNSKCCWEWDNVNALFTHAFGVASDFIYPYRTLSTGCCCCYFYFQFTL